MADQRKEKTELTSLNQLIQDIIGGTARRHTFMQWELELLLDLQLCRVRKSARPELLRRYVKAVHAHYTHGADGPLRLSTFLDHESDKARGVTVVRNDAPNTGVVHSEEPAESHLAHARM